MPATASDSAVPLTLKEKVRRLPDKPGVYLMKDRLGRIIYVGKAKALKRRVSSYFQPSRAFALHPCAPAPSRGPGVAIEPSGNC